MGLEQTGQQVGADVPVSEQRKIGGSKSKAALRAEGHDVGFSQKELREQRGAQARAKRDLAKMFIGQGLSDEEVASLAGYDDPAAITKMRGRMGILKRKSPVSSEEAAEERNARRERVEEKRRMLALAASLIDSKNFSNEEIAKQTGFHVNSIARMRRNRTGELSKTGPKTVTETPIGHEIANTPMIRQFLEYRARKGDDITREIVRQMLLGEVNYAEIGRRFNRSPKVIVNRASRLWGKAMEQVKR